MHLNMIVFFALWKNTVFILIHYFSVLSISKYENICIYIIEWHSRGNWLIYIKNYCNVAMIYNHLDPIVQSWNAIEIPLNLKACKLEKIIDKKSYPAIFKPANWPNLRKRVYMTYKQEYNCNEWKGCQLIPLMDMM